MYTVGTWRGDGHRRVALIRSPFTRGYRPALDAVWTPVSAIAVRNQSFIAVEAAATAESDNMRESRTEADIAKSSPTELGLVTDDERDTADGAPAHQRDDAADDVDYRAHPERYESGRGEEGVFTVQPYKSELLPLWGYADRETADKGGRAIYERFRQYERDGAFVGMDMARKYLKMGYTRAMRYAKYSGGQKYVDSEERDPVYWADPDKREAALVYRAWLRKVRDSDEYQRLKAQHREQHG